MQILIKAKADLNIRSQLGKTPLHIAVMFGEHEIVKSLLEANAAVYIQDVNQETPINWAAKSSHPISRLIYSLLLAHDNPSDLLKEYERKQVSEKNKILQDMSINNNKYSFHFFPSLQNPHVFSPEFPGVFFPQQHSMGSNQQQSRLAIQSSGSTDNNVKKEGEHPKKKRKITALPAEIFSSVQPDSHQEDGSEKPKSPVQADSRQEDGSEKPKSLSL